MKEAYDYEKNIHGHLLRWAYTRHAAHAARLHVCIAAVLI